VSGWPARLGKRLGDVRRGNQRVWDRDDRRVGVTVLGEPGKARPRACRLATPPPLVRQLIAVQGGVRGRISAELIYCKSVDEVDGSKGPRP